jgi:hypothetical protein
MSLLLNLHKMATVMAEPVKYYLKSKDTNFFVNDLIGHNIKLSFKNQINCINCGAIIKTTFAQGYCYPCFITSPETEDCVLRPELCLAHTGVARDMDYARDHCLIDHLVYLAYSGGLKVGVTRYTQKPFRWIDQGASQAIVVSKTPNRFLAGSIEVALKKHFPDKTNWRKMLSSDGFNEINLINEKERAVQFLHSDFKKYRYEDDTITEIKFPVLEYPSKIKSLGFDKAQEISGTLTGIKGQYLIFNSGEVINIRKHGGYLVEIARI